MSPLPPGKELPVKAAAGGVYIGALAVLSAALPGRASGPSTAAGSSFTLTRWPQWRQAIRCRRRCRAVGGGPGTCKPGRLTSWTLGLRDTETDSDNHFLPAAAPAFISPGCCRSSAGSKLGAGLELCARRSAAGVCRQADPVAGLSAALRRCRSACYGPPVRQPHCPSYDGLNTVSLGARLRLWRYLAVGVVLHDLSGPAAEALPLLPVGAAAFEGEALLRPAWRRSLRASPAPLAAASRRKSCGRSCGCGSARPAVWRWGAGRGALYPGRRRPRLLVWRRRAARFHFRRIFRLRLGRKPSDQHRPG